MVPGYQEAGVRDRIDIHQGDCLQVLADMASQGVLVDSCVTDPPYHLTSIVRRFGSESAAPAKSNGATGVYARASVGFMGQQWDGGDVAFRAETWRAVFDVLKPGGHLLAFSATRTYHRMVCAIEDAGFEVRDQIGWLYGSGFPKSHNAGNGWGTALKPAWEPLVLARKPLVGTVAENVVLHGCGALNIDGCRIVGPVDGPGTTPKSPVGGRRGSMAGVMDRVEYDGTKGRWPANVIHDGSDEVLEAFAAYGDDKGQSAPLNRRGADKFRSTYGAFEGQPGAAFEPHDGLGSAARFFYSAKAQGDERVGEHPTQKPRELMRYLVRLVTPKGGLVLDPFAGTGTTGEAAMLEGMRALLIEREPRYVELIRQRIGRHSGEGTPLFGGLVA